MSHETKWEESGVYWRFFGVVSFDEISETSTEVYGDHRFDKMRYQIVDFLDMTQLEWTVPQIEVVAAMDSAAAMTNPRVKIAVIATHTQAQEITEAYSAASVGSPWQTEIFDNIGDARQWLEA